MIEKPLEFTTYYEEQLKIAERFVTLRKEKKITQKRLSIISGVTYSSIRRFEKTGEISFRSLIKLMLSLQLYDDINNLFKVNKVYASIKEVIDDRKD